MEATAELTREERLDAYASEELPWECTVYVTNAIDPMESMFLSMLMPRRESVEVWVYPPPEPGVTSDREYIQREGILLTTRDRWMLQVNPEGKSRKLVPRPDTVWCGVG